MAGFLMGCYFPTGADLRPNKGQKQQVTWLLISSLNLLPKCQQLIEIGRKARQFLISH